MDPHHTAASASLHGIQGALPPLPAWHLGQLTLHVVGHDGGHPAWSHVAVLAAGFAFQRRLQRT